MMGACARNMYSDSAEIKPAQCCIKLVFHLTYTMMHGSTKLKFKGTAVHTLEEWGTTPLILDHSIRVRSDHLHVQVTLTTRKVPLVPTE